ncbi:amino acid adenylation domain-containing protein [Nostocales cyanobacterium LEGE 11386]|nr:amino acid adenylation domain-containing protein [Nostocales cyanobacterium LEGE 11386]
MELGVMSSEKEIISLKSQLSPVKKALLEKRLQGKNEKKLSPSAQEQLPNIVPNIDERYQPFPLTDIQQAYWIGRQGDFELGNVSTHGYLEIETVNLHIPKLQTAWQRLINQHEMLRVIVQTNGQQRILSQVPPYQIPVVDLRGKKPDLVVGQLAAIRDRLSHQIFSADQWPLFEFCAVQLDGNKVRLCISLDVLIGDAWSFEIFLGELAQLIKNPDVDLPQYQLSFRDYVLAEIALRETKLYQRSQAYWRRRLPTLPASPELPLVKNLASINSPHFVRRTGKLPNSVWSRLKNRAREVNLTPSGLILAAFAEIITLWSKNPQFTINLTLFNRLPMHPEVNQIVGDFTSLNLLAVDNSGQDSFTARSQRIQKQLWHDLEHRYYSGVQVLRDLARIQQRPFGALMPVVFTSMLTQESLSREKFTDNSSSAQSASIHRLGELTYMITQTPQVYLDHQVYETAGTLVFSWDAVEEVFPPGLLDDMFTAYSNFLENLANHDQLWQTPTRQLLPTAHIAQQAAINATQVQLAESTLLHDLFLAQVPLHPQKAAIVTPHCNLTYQELSLRVYQLAHQLRQLGTRPNQLVAIVMTKGWEQILASLSILVAGAAYVPIDPNLPQERCWHLLQQSEVKVVLTQSLLDTSLEWPQYITRLCIDHLPPPSQIELLESVQQPDDLAYVIYTSGSTGLPKGVMINHQGAVNTILDINQRFQVTAEDKVFALSSLSFDLSVYDIFGTLAAGGTLVIPDAESTKNPADWVQLITQQQITIWNSVPALMQMLVEYVGDEHSSLPQSLRLVMLSGDWLPVSLPERIRTLFKNAQVISLGGATEASIWSIFYTIDQIDPTWKSIPYGRPLTNQHFYVLNTALEPCPTWVSGQLYIGGVGLALGYWHNPEKTNSSFFIHPQTQERLYKTGDLGRYLPDGNIEFLGREDYQVKVNGYRIELGEIEATLEQHSAVKEGVVTAVGEFKDNQQLIAYIVPNENASSLFQTESTDFFHIQQLWPSLVKTGYQQAQQNFWDIDLQTFSQLWQHQNYLYVISVCRALRKLGVYHTVGEKYKIDDLLCQCQIAPRYRKWLERALKELVKEGLLQQNGEVFTSLREFPNFVAQNLPADVAAILSQSNEFTKVWLEILTPDNTENLADIITENVHSAQFYVDEKITDFYQKMFGYCHAIFREIIKTVVQNLQPDQYLRILEVGGGYGSSTMHLLPLLPPEKTSYVFTDISQFFLQNAQEKFGNYPFVSYDLLDFDQNPQEQGYQAHSFDVIIASSALHDTRNIEKTLQYLNSLLTANGLLFIIEETKFHRSFDLHMGIQQGFDRFADEPLRSNHPLLSRKQWQQILSHQGFVESVVFNHPGYIADFIGIDVLVARSSSTVSRFYPQQLRDFLAKKLPEYMIPADFILLDALPLTANGKLNRLALPTLKGRRPTLPTTYVMPQTKTEKAIASVWQEVLQVKQVGIQDNFFDLGGDSLLLVKMQVKLTEILNTELPIIEMLKYPTIASLTEYFSQQKSREMASQQGRDRAHYRHARNQQRKSAISDN